MLAYSGKGKFVVEALDLSALIPEMSGLVRPSISKKIALHFDLEPDLPPIEADRGQVQQVFMNLALNAAEAIGSHDGLISVRTGVQDVDDRLFAAPPGGGGAAAGQIRFPGSARHRLRHGRRHQGQNLRSLLLHQVHRAGAGAGGRFRHLARPPRRHRGHQRAGQRQLLHGALPGGARAPPSEHRAAARNAALQGAGVVLVVDDEPLVREMAKRALERHGYTVLLAESGPVAIDVFRRHPGEIALVVLDLSMPQMSGEETLPELKRSDRA